MEQMDSIISKLDREQLLVFRERIDRRLQSIQDQTNSDNFTGSAEHYHTDYAAPTTSPTAASFQQLRPPISQASLMGNSCTLGTKSGQAPAHPSISGLQHQRSDTFRPRNAEQNKYRGDMSRWSRSQETLKPDELDLSSTNSSLALRTSKNTKKIFICTFCIEEKGEVKKFAAKPDGKKHQQKYHDTGMDWYCNSCTQKYVRLVDLYNHYKENHSQTFKEAEVHTSRPRQTVYGCGYEGCRRYTGTWTDYYNHVVDEHKHFESDDLEHIVETWSYTQTIQNILRHKQFKDTWKKVYKRWGEHTSIKKSDLRWDPETAKNMRRELSCLNFSGSLESFLTMLFKKGHPCYSVSSSFSVQLQPPEGPSSTMFPPGDHRFDSNYGLGYFEPSFPDSFGQISDAQDHASFVTGSKASTDSSGNRFSVVMEDADAVPTPPAHDPQSCIDPQLLMTPPPYFTNPTPPVDSFEDGSMEDSTIVQAHPPRRSFRNKGKGLLPRKGSFCFPQHVILDHPDLPLNTRIPSASRRSSGRSQRPYVDPALLLHGAL